MVDDLLGALINDEKKINRSLYSSGPYWDYQNRRTIYQLKKNKIKDFRGIHSSVGTGFCDNLICDIRNEYNLKGRMLSLFYKLPIINKIFSSQIKLTSQYIDLYIKNLSIVYKNNKRIDYLLNKYSFENTTKFGCVQKFIKDHKEFSITYLTMANRIDILSRKFNFKKIKNYFEIGGGFGSNIHFLLTNFHNIKKIIYLDAVPNIYVGTEYLRFFYKENVKDYLHTKNYKEIKFQENDKLEIICIPPWEIEKININIDHFHNALSFVEMPEKVIENYVKFLKKNNLNEISLISYDGYDTNSTINPDILNKFFNNELAAEWHYNAIEEYNRKSFYLTSSTYKE